jgi:hypothetical protein
MIILFIQLLTTCTCEGNKTDHQPCPSDILSPCFSEYTNNEPLKTNFRFIDPPPKKNQTKNKSHFGAVSPQKFILQLQYS